MSGVIRGGGGSAGPSLNERRERSQGPGWQGWLLLCTAVVPAFLALTTLLGVGLERQLPAQVALLVAMFLTVLPVLGLASPFRLRGKVVPVAVGAWAWSAALLLGAPLYFPSEPGEPARAGIAWLLEPLGEDLASGVADAGAGVLATLLPEITALPMADSLPVESEEARTPRSVPVGAAAVIEEPEVEQSSGPTGRVVLPYEGAGRSMRVPVTMGGPDGDLELTMLFDTGATLTTLNKATLARLGIPVPPDAPVVTLQTANGQVEAPLVLIDAVWLGEERIDWATVAVCSACADGGVSGLLGLNVSGLFQVSLDHEEREIDLTRRPQQGDRHEDVTHWVQLDSTARVWTDRRVEVDVTAENRSRAPMDGLTVEVACHDRSFAVALEPLEPGAARTAEVVLPRGTDCREYRVMLREGRWQVD